MVSPHHSNFTFQLTILFQAAFIKRAVPEQLKKVFDEFANIELDGKKYMTYDAFIFLYLGLFAKSNQECGQEVSEYLAATVDRDQDGLISFEDFLETEKLLCSPEAYNKTLFRVFDKGTGFVTYGRLGKPFRKSGHKVYFLDSFIKIMMNNIRYDKIKFDINSRLISYYFGKAKDRRLDYNEFSHFMKDFTDEILHEAFKQGDVGGKGIIPCSEFVRIAVLLRGHVIRSSVNKYFGIVSESSKDWRAVS